MNHKSLTPWSLSITILLLLPILLIDRERAHSFSQKVADAGNAAGYLALGHVLCEDKKYYEAVEKLSFASQFGLATAQFELGQIYEVNHRDEEKVQQDMPRAIKSARLPRCC